MKLTDKQLRKIRDEKSIFVNVLEIFSKGFLCALKLPGNEETFREYDERFKKLFHAIDNFAFGKDIDSFQFGCEIAEYFNNIIWKIYEINPNMLKDLEENYKRFRVNVNNIMMEKE